MGVCLCCAREKDVLVVCVSAQEHEICHSRLIFLPPFLYYDFSNCTETSESLTKLCTLCCVFLNTQYANCSFFFLSSLPSPLLPSDSDICTLALFLMLFWLVFFKCHCHSDLQRSWLFFFSATAA